MKLVVVKNTLLAKALEKAEKAEQERIRAIETANARLIQAEILAEATAQQAIKPEHLHRLIDTSAVTVADDGTVTGAKDAVKAFLDASPEYLTRPGKPGPVDQGARGGSNGVRQLTRDDLKSMSPEQIVQARQEGKLDQMLAGGR